MEELVLLCKIDWYLLLFFFVFVDILKGKNEINIENGNGELNLLIEKLKLCKVDIIKKGLVLNF